MTDDEDLVLKTLLAVGPEVAPNLDEKILRQCYAIQKKHQFTEDRTISLAAMERLIDEAVLQIAGGSKE